MPTTGDSAPDLSILVPVLDGEEGLIRLLDAVQGAFESFGGGGCRVCDLRAISAGIQPPLPVSMPRAVA